MCVALCYYIIGAGLGWQSLGGLLVWLELAVPGKAACKAWRSLGRLPVRLASAIPGKAACVGGVGDPWEGCLGGWRWRSLGRLPVRLEMAIPGGCL